MKDFTEEISLLFEKFQKGAPFAFSKFADGEWSAMHNETLNNSEFENTTETNEKYRGELRARPAIPRPELLYWNLLSLL